MLAIWVLPSSKKLNATQQLKFEGKFNKDKGVYENIVYIPTSVENNFTPNFPERVPDMIYLCFPNNPTGTTLT